MEGHEEETWFEDRMWVRKRFVVATAVGPRGREDRALSRGETGP